MAEPSKEKKSADFDPVVECIGEGGKWQTCTWFTIAYSMFVAGFYKLSVLYLTAPVPFRCKTDLSIQVHSFDNVCQQDCKEYEFDNTVFQSTIETKWSLICKDKWLSSFTHTIFTIGMIVGSFGFGYFADRFGRKSALLFVITLIVITGFSMSFSPNVITLIILRFVLGTCVGGIIHNALVVVVETVGPGYRTMAVSLYHIPFYLGKLYMTLIAYFLRSWNSFIMGLAITSLPLLLYFWLLSESPRWLISKGNFDKAENLMTQIAKRNKMETKDIPILMQEAQHRYHQNENVNEPKRANVLDLFRSFELTKRFLVLCFLYVIPGLCYFGMVQFLSIYNSNVIFISIIGPPIVQIPSMFLAIFVINNIGKKFTIACGFFITSLFNFSLIILPEGWPRIVIGSLGIGCLSLTGSTLGLYCSELFPTVLRNTAISATFISHAVGSSIAPFVNNFSIQYWIPLTVYGSVSLLGACVAIFIPSPKVIKLPDSIKECEKAAK